MKNLAGRSRRLLRAPLCFGVSCIAIVASSEVAAQCLPDPTTANEVTACTGPDNNGLTVTTSDTTVVVGQGATVSNSAGPAIAIDIPNGDLPRLTSIISIAGAAMGNANPGILLMSGTRGRWSAPSTNLALTVAVDGQLSGATALSLAHSAGNTDARLYVSIDNAGTIQGTSGVSLQGNLASTVNGYTTPYSGFNVVINRETGMIIGTIAGPVASLDNAGVINGGNASAFSAGEATTLSFPLTYGTWRNTGTIKSNSTEATIRSFTIEKLTNSGSIVNDGNGSALTPSYAFIDNQAGGLIKSAGAIAIQSSSGIQLSNAGTIIGNVITGPANSMVDSTLGTIQGSIYFGAGYNTLYVRYSGQSTPITGVTGPISTGTGNNTQLLRVDADTSITTGLALLPGFQRYGALIDKDRTLTLEQGYSAPASIFVTGAGTLLNRSFMVLSDKAFELDSVSAPNAPRLINEGEIRTTGSGFWAIDAQYGSSVTNSGIIDAAGNGVQIFQGGLQNSGTIVAVRNAVAISGSGMINSGTIRSIGDTAVQLRGSAGINSTNTGLIEGATAGVVLGTYLTNQGTIRATDSAGVAIQLTAYGALINEVGGVVGTVGGKAITASVFNETVINAGTINGSVEFSESGGGRYISRSGGILNGDLVLGSAATFMTDLSNNGAGLFSGVNGTVSASEGARLRYRVSGTASTDAGAIGPFASSEFELVDGSALTLTSANPLTKTLVLAGKGSVELLADLTISTPSSGFAALRTDQAIDGFMAGGYVGPASELDIISRGLIDVTRSLNDTSLGAVVAVGMYDRFVNAGTINVTNLQSYPLLTAIVGGDVTNDGTINLNGAAGMSGGSLTNNGVIQQVFGGANARGVLVAQQFVNNGSIQVGGDAVSLGSGSLINAGLIDSSGGIAVVNEYAQGSIINRAGGIISSGIGNAIQGNLTSFINEGSVLGNVDMGRQNANLRAYDSAAYIAAGGTISGDLRFGDGADLFMQIDAANGVSGVIDGGGGRDIYGVVRAISGAFALTAPPALNFEDWLVKVDGESTTITLTSPNSFDDNVYMIGDGAAVNEAAVNGSLSTMLRYPDTISASETRLGSLLNKGLIAGGVVGDIATFSNEGTIGKAALTSPALSLTRSDALTVANSGTIVSNSANSPLGQRNLAATISGTDTIDITNSGLIDGGMSAKLWTADNIASGSIQLINSGQITANGGGFLANALDVGTFTLGSQDDISISNSGIIAAQTAAGTAIAIRLTGASATARVTNSSTGLIQASGQAAAGIGGDAALDLTNDGVINAEALVGLGRAITMSGANDDYVRNNGIITGAILLGDGNDVIENHGTIHGNILLGAGDDTFLLTDGGTVNGTIDGGEGTDRLLFGNQAQTVLTGTVIGFERLAEIGTQPFVISGTLGATGDNMMIEDSGAHQVVVQAGGKIGGTVNLSEGDDHVLLMSDAQLTGEVVGGAGYDIATLDLTTDVALNGNALQQFELLNTTGVGALRFTLGAARFEQLSMSGKALQIDAGASLSVDKLMMENALARLTIAGAFDGRIDLGAGDNVVRLTGTQSLSGTLDAGAGNDRLEIASSGTETAPLSLGNTAFVNFDILEIQSGVTSYGGASNFGTMTINGGRFIGLAGSRLTVPNISVAPGATFGSAGTVVGNLDVAGTLSPGASPGTMTVNGNVNLVGGSTSLFEIDTGVSDLLLISGSLTIAPNATLRLDGDRPLTPGVTLDLIIADGGINGSFTTIDKAGTVQGFLRQSTTKLSLLGTFLSDISFSPQVNTSIDYFNNVLVSGEASSGLIAAVPRLLTSSGSTNDGAFKQISAEAYASAEQLGVEHALTIIEASRSQGISPSRSGIFTFGQILSNNRRFSHDLRRGIDGARLQTWGGLAGIGINLRQGWAGVFAGYLTGHQRIAGLAANTESNGFIAGLQGRWQAGALKIGAIAAYSGGHARTERTPLGTALSARYTLRNWVGDVRTSYAVPLGNAWSLSPSIGFSGVRTLRGSLSETGSSPFALSVLKAERTLLLLNADVMLEGGRAESDKIHPFAAIGIQRRLKGRNSAATARYEGVEASYSIPGLERQEMMATTRVGLSYDVSRRLSAFATYAGEMGDETRHNGSVGIRLTM
ncbi:MULTISPECIES: autotransporter domain-containing protein [unclassified Sphingobium]|uniref:autotransporter domain-containing protein n=1 Tax=unclassified Sphingobium TaxID=2611147 RepID=UPI0022254C11|nr:MULTISPECIES: autotransporter outer membrane beta-barrel domain-containing protein [unclassified Sphingobium]MCW2382176.1 hypothetical protein [Sphingobium sp. B2D3B]MCW2397651.1 hypothetical protein [Sphingobium sp. B2D3C]